VNQPSNEVLWAQFMAAAIAGCGGRLSEEDCARVADRALREHRQRYPKVGTV
jgi:hypothetical protein